MSFNLSLMHTSGLLRHLDNLHSFGQDQLAIDALDHSESSLTLICEKLVKAADKLSAYIKCVEELKAGNMEFKKAAEQTRRALSEMHMPELDYFMVNCMESFSMTLDELE